MPKVPKIDSHIFAISPENRGDEVDFSPADKLKSFLQVDSITRHPQSTPNNKFTISLQYLKESVKDEVGILPADKSQTFLQNDTIILGLSGPQISQNNNFAISLQYLKKKVSDEVGFLHANKYESLL